MTIRTQMAVSGVQRNVTLATLTLLLLVAHARADDVPPSSGAASEENTSLGDRFCGPRCVQYLLDFYKLESEDLIALVREIQWPDLEEGASLERMENALKKRGIHTTPISVPENCALRWHSPAVVHLKDDGADLGHFAVWLPESTDDMVKVWGGLGGVRALEEQEFSKLFTGAVLLTSRESIGDPRSAVVNRGPVIGGIRLLTAATVVIGVAFVVVGFVLRGRPSVFGFTNATRKGDSS